MKPEDLFKKLRRLDDIEKLKKGRLSDEHVIEHGNLMRELAEYASRMSVEDLLGIYRAVGRKETLAAQKTLHYQR